MLESLAEIRALSPEASSKRGPDEARELLQRLDEMQEIFETFSALAQRFAGPGGPGLRLAAKLLAKAPLPRDARERTP
jgi:hypothetical protein